MRNSKHGRIYVEKEKLGRLEYIKVGGKIKDVILKARVRLGNLENGHRYWYNENKKRCLFCGEGWDSLEHWLTDCKEMKDWREEYKENSSEGLNAILSKKWVAGCKKMLKTLVKKKANGDEKFLSMMRNGK